MSSEFQLPFRDSSPPPQENNFPLRRFQLPFRDSSSGTSSWALGWATFQLPFRDSWRVTRYTQPCKGEFQLPFRDSAVYIPLPVHIQYAFQLPFRDSDQGHVRTGGWRVYFNSLFGILNAVFRMALPVIPLHFNSLFGIPGVGALIPAPRYYLFQLPFRDSVRSTSRPRACW